MQSLSLSLSLALGDLSDLSLSRSLSLSLSSLFSGMGNCLRSNKVLAEYHDDDERPRESKVVNEQTQQAISTNVTTPSTLATSPEKKKKKVVSFRFTEEQEAKEENKVKFGGRGINNNSSSASGDSESGVTRIKLVLTKEELKQVVEYMNNGSEDHNQYSSLHHLLSVIKSRGQRVSEGAGTSSSAHEGGRLLNESWTPMLETIAED